MNIPSWFKNSEVLIVNAKTCGINKDGKEQYLVSSATGVRSDSKIDDTLAECCDAVVAGDFSREEVFYHQYENMIIKDVFVPKFYDYRTTKKMADLLTKHEGFELKSLGELRDEGVIRVFGGHGSPSSDQRVGIVPYIKVSDLRAGHVNINPTNMVPRELAQGFWKAKSSGLVAYDLISPERASKNIGEFCVLMPGQESVVLTKEVIVARACSDLFDQFYLLWALSLKEVREQWERVVFMQTNREDVGSRMLEIQIPVPKSRLLADECSLAFRNYYQSLRVSREKLIKSLACSDFSHHVYLGD